MTVNEIYQSGLKLLENNNIENSKFEAQSLLQKAFSLDRVGLYHATKLIKRMKTVHIKLFKIYRKNEFQASVAVYSRRMELYGIRF